MYSNEGRRDGETAKEQGKISPVAFYRQLFHVMADRPVQMRDGSP